MALAVASVLLLVPGLGAVLALFRPRALGAPLGLALTLALGYAGSALLATTLTVLGLLTPGVFFTLLAVLTAGAWTVGLRRASLRERVQAWRDGDRRDRVVVGLGLAVLVAIALIRLSYPAEANLHSASAFRYWADALEIADARGVPDASLQWGMPLPPTVSKVALNSFNAAASFAIGDEALPALAALLWLGSVGVAVALWAFGRELGLRFTAPLLPVLLTANHVVLDPEMTEDLHTYKAEAFGRLVAFAALATAVRALRARDERVRYAVVAGVLFAAGAATHLVPVLVAAAFLGFYAVAVAVRDRAVTAPARVVGITLGVAAVLGALVLLVPRGDVGFEGVREGERYSAFREDFDPTRFFISGRLDAATERGGEPWYYPPGELWREFVSRTTGLEHSAALGVALAAGGLVAAVAMLVWFPRDVRPVGLAALGLAATLIAVALFFSYRYDTFIPARFGLRRMFEYGPVPLVLVALALLEVLLVAVSTRWGRAGAVAAVLGLALASGLVLVRAAPPPTLERGTDAGGRLLSWMRTNLPCDARILSNQRSAGAFQALTGRAGVLEGMAPYLRPRVLEEVVELQLGARRFFGRPARNHAFLEEEAIDYVVVAPTAEIGAAGANLHFRRRQLAAAPFLELVHETPEAAVFRVRDEDRAAHDLPRPGDYPGYRCRRGAIA